MPAPSFSIVEGKIIFKDKWGKLLLEYNFISRIIPIPHEAA